MNTAAPTLTKQSEIMIDTRYSQLKQMLEDHRRRLQRSLRVRLRDVRANNGHDGNVVEKEIGERSRRFSSERNDSLLRYNLDTSALASGNRFVASSSLDR